MLRPQVVYEVPNLPVKRGHLTTKVREVRFWVSSRGWLHCSVPIDQQDSTWFRELVDDALTRLPEGKLVP